MKLFRKINWYCNNSSSRNRVILLFLALGLTGISNARAENPDTLRTRTPLIIAGYFQYGKVLVTNTYLRQTYPSNDADNIFTAISFQVLKQTTGDKFWQQGYGFPSYGLGVYSASFLNNNRFGTPIAIYGVFKGPFKRWNKVSFNYETGFGFTFNWEEYNPLENNYNISMGAEESVFIDAGISLSYLLSSYFDLEVGYSFTHFSNGALKSPNYGLNTFSPKIRLEYHINRFNPPLSKQIVPPFIKNTSIDFSIFGGAKNVIYTGNDVDTSTKYKGVNYPVFGFTTVINRYVNYKSKFGIGMSLSYDGSYNSTIFVDKGELETQEGFHENKLSLSVFPSYELVINKLSLVIQPGFDIFRKQSINKKPLAYQRLGLQYRLGENMFAGISLHAYSFHVSDFIEWTFGYRLPVSKKGD